MNEDDAKAQLARAEAVIARAYGWATHRVPGYSLENQMAEVADALESYQIRKVS